MWRNWGLGESNITIRKTPLGKNNDHSECWFLCAGCWFREEMWLCGSLLWNDPATKRACNSLLISLFKYLFAWRLLRLKKEICMQRPKQATQSLYLLPIEFLCCVLFFRLHPSVGMALGSSVEPEFIFQFFSYHNKLFLPQQMFQVLKSKMLYNQSFKPLNRHIHKAHYLVHRMGQPHSTRKKTL